MARAPSDVYARQLFPKKYGIPLFIPEPNGNLPPDYHDQGASIGDVGTVTSDGSFSFVFNICTPSDNPVNCNGVPEGFKQVSLLPGEIFHTNMFPPASDVSSASVRKVGLNTGGALNLANGFTSALSEAAILALPSGASRQDLLDINKFRGHAIENAIRWYEFVNGNLGREAPNGSLYLVTGCDKSTTWGIASVAGATQVNGPSLRFTAAQPHQAGAEYTHSWETHCPATVRIGPSGLSPLQNQCVFLRGFKLTLREGPMADPAKVSPILNAKPHRILPGGKGGYVRFMNDGQQSSPILRNAASSDGHQMMDASSGYHRADDEVTEEASSEEDVLLESIPGAAEVIVSEHFFDAQLTCVYVLLGISSIERHRGSFICLCTSLQSYSLHLLTRSAGPRS
ncbi:hypothetical protein PILCRDRAFT_57789 [Piloderma croceum F 1598]|uniref:Uncharacterized protein n=1 Tax=Piloderma croceum (strain F 1598) TaxID=765440 RepID=A0A0C3GIZ8_PILCF|nr:hypothetical protein PILCRDRAFT_57789 [Piloderma croceum F 1598]